MSQKIAAARLSIYSNSALTLIKLLAGAATGSVSVLSEAAHSGTDLVASWIAFFAVRASDRPADEEHPYGHGKIESLSGMAQALLIFAAGAWVLYEAVIKMTRQEAPERLDLGIAVMAGSSIVNTVVASYLFRVAKQTDSVALEADALHLRTDVFTSASVMVGLVLVRITGHTWLDPAIAIVVTLLILHAAWRLTWSALNPLLDTRLPAEETDAVQDILVGDARVLGYHKLRTRKSGSARYVDAHILLDDDLSLIEAHELTEELEDLIRGRLVNVEVTLHMEPFRRERQHQYERHGGPPPE